MDAVSLLLSKQSKSQQIRHSLITTFPHFLLCLSDAEAAITWPFPEHFEFYVPEISHFLLISKPFNLWHNLSFNFCLLLELLLLSTACFSSAFFLLRISLCYRNIYFCDVLPAPIQEVLVFDLVPREENKAKVIVLAKTTELEVPVSWLVPGEMAGKDPAQT